MQKLSQAPTVYACHAEIVQARLPEWLRDLTADEVSALKTFSSSLWDWFDQSSRSHPHITRELLHDYAAYRKSTGPLAVTLATLPTVEEYAAPLLAAAIKARFRIDLDVRTAYLNDARLWFSHATHIKVANYPTDIHKPVLRTDYRTLLTAALQNFSPSETALGALDFDTRIRAKIATGPSLDKHTLYDIEPAHFAALCRDLDLGQGYQDLIDSTLADTQQQRMAERSALLVEAHMAYLKGDVGEVSYERIKAAAAGQAPDDGTASLTAYELRLWDTPLNGVLVLSGDLDSAERALPVIVHIPGDPVTPLKEYPSSTAFAQALVKRLEQMNYLNFFQRFFPARHRTELREKVVASIYPYVWSPEANLSRRQRSANPSLHLRASKLPGSPLDEMLNRKVALLKNDALFHAVPTRLKDQQAFDERIHHYLALGFGALNAAAFIVPVVGQAMAVVNVMQLASETFDGIQAWSRGEQEQAWSYLTDVIENVVLIGALGTADQSGVPAREIIPVETPSFITELEPVTLPDGQERLWKPDMTPYAHDIVLPPGLQPDQYGIYHYQGKAWVAIEDRFFAVTRNRNEGDYRARHTTLVGTYEPKLRHNGVGTWQHELDRPLQWQGARLARRLGPDFWRLDEQTVQRLLRISDIHEAVLRRALSENDRPPALLEDARRRFAADEQARQAYPASEASARTEAFENCYLALSSTDDPAALAIQQHYPGLPAVIAEELGFHATTEELNQLAQGHVPLRLAAEIRVYQQEVRLARAYEKLYLQTPAYNPDSDRLIFHSLDRITGWSDQLRLEIRDRWYGGSLIDSIGQPNAQTRKILVREGSLYQAQDDQGLHLHGADDLYASVLHALPDDMRTALGFPGTWQGQDLKAAIEHNLLPRHALRKLLGMQPSHPSRVPPMRLAGGRIGYALSGRGALSGFIARETLLDLILMLQLGSNLDLEPENILRALEANYDRQSILDRLRQLLDERSQLAQALDTWGAGSAHSLDPQAEAPARTRLVEAIWQAWFDTALHDVIQTPTTLWLQEITPTLLPTRLPAFLIQRIRQLRIQTTTPTAHDLVRAHETMVTFLEQFNDLRSLELTTPIYNPSNVSRPLLSTLLSRFPNLQELRLINQSLVIGAWEIQGLRTMPHLEVLDLSGNLVPAPANLAHLLQLRLRYLGLDRIALRQWPTWIAPANLEGVGVLSLRENNITSIPDDLFNQPSSDAAQTRINLHGNVLTDRTIRRILLDWNHPEFPLRFELDVPQWLQTRIGHLQTERSELNAAIEQWTYGQASSSTQAADRQHIGECIMNAWRRQAEGDNFSALELRNVSLEHFPEQLPAFFCDRLRSLQLDRITFWQPQLDNFLMRFPNLEALRMHGHVYPLQAVPNALLRLDQLRTVVLVDQGLLVDQQAMTLFGQMRQLDTLELSGNTIGQITDHSTLPRRLSMLHLDNTGLVAWPEWVEPMQPLSVLDLDHNQISTLPAHILENPRDDGIHTEISLMGNPLSRETMIRAHTSEGYHRRYSFNIDLPPDIEAMSPDIHSDSDSSSSASIGHVHSPIPLEQEVPNVAHWLSTQDGQASTRRAVWARLQQQDANDNLLRLVQRLTHTAPYRNPALRPELVPRVWAVLEAADRDDDLRALCNGIAQDALPQADGNQTCADGALLVFGQIEQQILLESILGGPREHYGENLFRWMRSQYRLQALDEYASAHLAGRDEAEVRLAYRLRLSAELDLPLPPQGMLYEASADVSQREREAVVEYVRQLEDGDGWLNYAAAQDRWVEYLKSTDEAYFSQQKEAYELSVLNLPDRYPGMTIEALQPMYDQLRLDYDSLMLSHLYQLTIQKGREYLHD
ncbi:dermonecrotic toxin domain-containing protein [Pseudomonas oryzicola]|uniref:RING-type E3 ubiquitin transferase n=1 Tax=Pseudomonas oryzicola TaxID=485876 RepID=A0ABS6Q5R2_9PSED|nr:DUF6543 domain-containing protein [Pseudomonas oryzicola]MBV4489508.1 hypothetical protein [Pseudomonas oryzicola]